MIEDEKRLFLIMKAFETEEGRKVLRATMHKHQVGNITINGEEILSAMFLTPREDENE